MTTKPHDYDKNVSEFCAKYTLEKLFPNEFVDLHKPKRNASGPDWITQDQSVGIEVTRVLFEHEKEDSAFFRKELNKKRLDDLPPEKLKDFYRNGNECMTGGKIKPEWEDVIIGYSYSSVGLNLEDCKKALIKKYNKTVSGKYVNCNVYDLYLFWIGVFEDEIDEAYKFIREDMSTFSMIFRYIYINTGEYVFRCDMHSNRFQKYEIRPYLREIVSKARASALIN